MILSTFKCVNTKLYFQIEKKSIEYKFFEKAWYFLTAKKNVILRMLYAWG